MLTITGTSHSSNDGDNNNNKQLLMKYKKVHVYLPFVYIMYIIYANHGSLCYQFTSNFTVQVLLLWPHTVQSPGKKKKPGWAPKMLDPGSITQFSQVT